MKPQTIILSARVVLVGTFALLMFVIPELSQAQTVEGARVIEVSSSTPNNAYYAGGQVTINVPLLADLSAIGGTLTLSAPIQGDALLAGGTIDIHKPIAGDVRVIGGRINLEDTVNGDFMAAGGIVNVSGKAKNTYIGGGTVQMTNGSNGPVTIYGATVSLSGEFNGDVQVVASDRVSVGPGTIIHGALKYNAPAQADIAASAMVDKGVTYIGAEPYLPTAQQAKTFALAGFWVFVLVRITAALVAVGLIAGLFPLLTDRVVEAALTRTPERFILMTLLGFAAFVAVPVLFLFLIVSFVGIGIAFIIGAAYILFLLLSYVYAAVLAGAALMRALRKKRNVSWRTAILGVLVLYLIGLVPVIGSVVEIVLGATAGGVLLSLLYQFAFRKYSRDLSEF
ncbi:hypothetical protein H0X32_00090 [Patescibacteria group bacterium]|nr:hypothetical protein [Patescibacteria group bacterium]